MIGTRYCTKNAEQPLIALSTFWGKVHSADNTTVWRWVQCYAPEINKRMRPHLKMSGTSYRLDETYVKFGTEWS